MVALKLSNFYNTVVVFDVVVVVVVVVVTHVSN